MLSVRALGWGYSGLNPTHQADSMMLSKSDSAANLHRKQTGRTDFGKCLAVNQRSIPLVLFFEFDEGQHDAKAAAFDSDPNHVVLGVALDLDIEGAGCWVPCQVVGVKKHSYQVVVCGLIASQTVFRHRVLLLGQQPDQYAASLARALQARVAAESHLRFNLCVDNMPTDDLPALTQAQHARIRNWAVNSKKLAMFGEASGMLVQLVQEVQREYSRGLNKCVLTDSFQDKTQCEVFRKLSLTLHAVKPRLPAPLVGTVPMATGAGKSFRGKTMMMEVEVIKALCNVHGECNKIVDLRLFATDLKKPMSLAEFQRLQQDCYKYTAQTLKRNWTENLRMGVALPLEPFSGTGSWKDLTCSDREAFDKSPIRPLLKQMQYVMEQGLRVLADLSIKAYTQMIDEIASFEVEILSTDTVKVKFVPPPHVVVSPGGGGGGGAAVAEPFFLLDLKIVEGMVNYTTKPADLGAEPIKIFDQGLSSISDITKLDSLLITKMFLGRLGSASLHVATVEDPEVHKAREKMVGQMKKAVKPLDAYLKLYDNYVEFLNTDISEYVRTYEERNLSLAEDQVEIQMLLNKRAAIESSIPDQVNLGLFVVRCAKVKWELQKKYDQLIRMILCLVAQKASENSKTVAVKFAAVRQKLQKTPQTIEEVVEMEDLLKDIPKQVMDIQQELGDMSEQFEVLDQFAYNLSDDESMDKWNAKMWPKKISDTVLAAEAAMLAKRESFKSEQEQAQEEFIKNLDSIEVIITNFYKHDDVRNLEHIAAQARQVSAKLAEYTGMAKQFNARELMYGQEQTDYERLSRITKIFEPYAQLWIGVDNWRRWQVQWKTGDFSQLDPEQMDKDIGDTWRNLFKASKALADFEGIANLAVSVRAEIDQFKPLMPIITALRNPGLRERHWDQLSVDLGFKVKPGETLNSLDDVIAMNLRSFEEKVVKSCEGAGKEYAIESALDKMQKEFQDIEFEIIPYRETGSFVLRGSDDIQQRLDDNTVMTQAMSFSPFKKAHGERLEAWGAKLNHMSEILEQWLNCQRNWMYLEPIFSSPDIMKQLPTEGQKFKACDRQWRKCLKIAADDPNALRFTDTPDLLGIFQGSYHTLEQVQKGLSDYLETKRMAFARFYFLSNEELLEILSQTKDPRAVQPHLRKCFEAIDKVTFLEDPSSESGLQMTVMFSGEGECVEWDGKVCPEGSVEHWLTEVETMMRISINTQIGLSVDDYAKTERPQWVLKWAGQVILACDQIYWSSETEDAIRQHKLQVYHQKCHQQLLDVTQLVRMDLTKLQRVSLGALVTLDVHGRDVIENLVKANVQKEGDFEWSAQLRYYWLESAQSYSGTHNAFLIQVENRFRYGCEYLGNSMRLVVTPLTDRIYLTLTGALGMALGGAPAGPAGTGKTETTKDLAKAMSKQCIVFNCQEGMDYIMVGKFFKGLSMSGAWACFDEFNRINIEVLSVIAQQLLTINQAIVNKLARFVFEGTEIPLNPENASFITMNPGYAGRTELPDNLKVLFRPVACMVPNYALIGEIRLFSFGFKDPRNLAEKMVNCFKLSSEQLGAQDHYDFGMRAVNTVISAAGLNKRSQPDADEAILMLRALKDSNLPKFLTDDIVLFSGIISDLFPGVKLPEADYGSLMEQLMASATDMGLQCVPTFMTKSIQLYDVTVLRHGLMLVGPTGGGKTQCKNMLANALTKLNKERDEYYEVRQLNMNPKSITMGQLYGSFDDATHEWSDGILCKLFREAVYDTVERQKWVVFDGPVDALWIESMNTVLDENKKLCLVSGEIITMTSWMRMVFEVEDLSVASPATVSRVGIIYLEPATSVGTGAMVDSWLLTLPGPVKQYGVVFKGLFNEMLDEVLDFHKRNLKEFVATVEPNLWRSVLNIIDGFLKEYHVSEGQDIDPERLAALIHNLEPIFVFAIVWGIGGAVNTESKAKMDTWIRSKKNLPAKNTVFDYSYDALESKWRGWMDTVTQKPIDPRKTFSEFIIPTPETVSYGWMVEHICTQMKHVLCIGPTGTGKTITVKQKLMTGMDASVYSPLFLTFSAQTSANQTQDILDGKMDKRRKGFFGPPAGKRYTIFVDDMNMPLREVYFAQPPIEILRQWMDHGGWYNRQLHQFSHIIDVMFVGAMAPPGGGRQPVTNRFLRHFNHIAFPEMSDGSLKMVFGSIFSAHLEAFFPAQLKSIVDPMCEASLGIYNACVQALLPTPAKSHYTFNLRDLAKIFQGVMMADPKKIGEDEAILVRLWLHESSRIFRDRLTDQPDRDWFDKLSAQLISEKFKKDWNKIKLTERSVFGDYMVPGADPRLYGEVADLGQLRTTMESYLEDYNAQTNKPMKLVLFLDAIEHVSKISRILRQPRGNALLLGVGGSGRQSLTRLAIYCGEMEEFQIEIAKGYGKNEWREDLKKILLRAGKDNKQVVFLFTDSQIVLESFLEDINNVLNSGEVPNIFDMADQEMIMSAIRPICQAEGIALTKANMYERFLSRVQANLHVVLAFSPVGDAFRNRLRQFPSLVTCCTIDWFTEWPAEALAGVANEAFAEIEFPSEEVKVGIVSLCRDIHQSVEKASIKYAEEMRRYNYVTPTSYLELLSTFRKVLGEKREEIGTARHRLSVGLDKISSTEVDVEKMKVDLVELQPVLVKTTAEVEELMIKIAKDKADAAEKKAVVEVEEKAASTKAAECKEIADSAEAGLAEALPALAAAVECLKNLKTSDISEVSKYSKPPDLVVLVLKGLCIMFGTKPTMEGQAGSKTENYWIPGKKMLGDAKGLLEQMFTFDKDNIPDKVIKAIQPVIDDPSFQPSKIQSVSSACTAMCQWTRAMHTYHYVALEVEPKRIALAAASAELKEVEGKLSILQSGLKELMDRLAKLDADFTSSVEKKEALAKRFEDCNIKMDRADRLLGGLGGEKVRWQQTVVRLGKQMECVVGDVIVAAGGIAYLGAFVALYREQQESFWQAQLQKYKIPSTPGSGLRVTLSEPVKIRAWNIAGLPTDSLSTENAIILSKSRRWSFMIDPQGQANKWIKNMEKEAGLEVIKLSEKEFLRSLVNAVRFGKPVLLENVGIELDPSLEPILAKQTFKMGGTEMIKIGDETIAYHPDFSFFITTKLPNPHYSPETCVKVTLLNFTVNASGLEDQLLGLVVGKERPDLQEAKNQLVLSMAAMKKTQKELEDKILKLLAESEGDILEDESLIIVLGEAKVTSDEISVKVAEAEKTEMEIDLTREKYRPTAYQGSLLFFCVSDLALVDTMYQYSLQWFLGLFQQGLENSEKAEDVPTRCRNVNDFFTYSLYKNICRGLFEKSKLLFSFTLAVKLMQGSNRIAASELRFLLSGATSTVTALPNPASSWLVESCWLDISDMSKLEKFKGLDQDFTDNTDAWNNFFDSNSCFKDELNGKWETHLDKFQKLLILRSLRQDKVPEGIMGFVSHEMGVRFIEPPPFNLPLAFDDSTAIVPLIFILSTGADPTMALLAFAGDQGYSDRLSSISLGQGQGPIAERKLAEATKAGAWLLLQNCHLAVSWMPKMEAIVEGFDPNVIHPDFRLWLTAMPSPQFPVAVLQNAVKMTLEPPKGLKNNVNGSMLGFSDEFYEECNKPNEYKKMLMSICWFHAVMQERRKFGPLGFNIAYDFSNSDRDCSIMQLRIFVSKYDTVPFKVIHELTGDVTYGGRITDDWDRRTMNCLLADYVQEGALTEGYQFSKDAHYVQPPLGEHKDYLACVAEWPIQAHPEAFGLHENADITCAQNEVKDLFETVLSLQARVSTGAGKSREDVIDEAAETLLNKTPAQWLMLDICKWYPITYDESQNTVLQQECMRYNKLLGQMTSTLKDVRKALKGLVVMSSELDGLATSLYNNQVPAMWESKAYPSLKPLVLWQEDLQRRASFVDDWVKNGLPATFWVSGFFFPQAFLTAILQNFARKAQIGIDTVSLEMRNLKVKNRDDPRPELERPKDGAIIWGLFLEGCAWSVEEHTLCESRPKELFTAYVPVWLAPVQYRVKPPDDKTFSCPCYKILTRKGVLSTTGHSSNFVCAFEVPTAIDPNHWVKRGVALFLSLVY